MEYRSQWRQPCHRKQVSPLGSLCIGYKLKNGGVKSRKTDSHPLFVYIAKAPSLQAANRCGDLRSLRSLRCSKQASTVRKGHSVHENPLFLHGRRFQRDSVLKIGFYGTEAHLQCAKRPPLGGEHYFLMRLSLFRTR